MTRKVYHIIKHGAIGWKSILENCGKVFAMGDNKQDIINRTIARAKCHTQCSVIIHKTDGSIQEERTFPKGTVPSH